MRTILIEPPVRTGKRQRFICEWCENLVVGCLIKQIINYEEDYTENQYICPECHWRVTKTIIKH